MTYPDGTLARISKAREHLAAGELGQVLDLCAPIVKAAPDEVEAAYLMAVATLRSGHALEAKILVDRARSQSPEDLALRILLTACLLEGGFVELACLNAEQVADQAGGNTEATRSLAQVRAKKADLKALIASPKRPALSEADRQALRNDAAANYRLVPIVINGRDRYSCLQRLIEWLIESGYKNVAVLDNGSTYPPLLNYYQDIEQEVSIFRLGHNLGHRALWTSGFAGAVVADVPFVYTDPDVLPIEECPADVVLRLHELLERNPQVPKAGLGIRIDDLPDFYRYRHAAIAWESPFWTRPLPGNCYDAPVDTTFALYRPGAWYGLDAVRSGFPYLARHLPWYRDDSVPDPEYQYYTAGALAGVSSWSGSKSPIPARRGA